MAFWHLSHMRAKKAQMNHCRCAVSPEHSLLALHKVVMLAKSYNKR